MAAVEADELAVGVGGFGDAVGDEDELIAGVELKVHDRKVGGVDRAEGKGAFHVEGSAVEVGRNMSGVSEGSGTIRGDAEGEADSVAGFAVEQAAVEGLENEERIGV